MHQAVNGDSCEIPVKKGTQIFPYHLMRMIHLVVFQNEAQTRGGIRRRLIGNRAQMTLCSKRLHAQRATLMSHQLLSGFQVTT